MINNIPKEVFSKITINLSVRTIIPLRSVCKQWYQFMDNNFWRNQYEFCIGPVICSANINWPKRMISIDLASNRHQSPLQHCLWTLMNGYFILFIKYYRSQPLSDLKVLLAAIISDYPGTEDIVSFLINTGSFPLGDIKVALQTAVEHNKPELLKLLLAAHPQDNISFSLLRQAAKDGYLHCVRILADLLPGKWPIALSVAVEQGHTSVVNYFLSRGIDPNSFTQPSLLYIASKNGHLSVVKLLLQFGVNPNPLWQGVTPLTAAAHQGHTEIVDILLCHGGTIPEGNNILYTAIKGKKLSIVTSLLAGGVNPDVPSPLHFAVDKGDLSVIKQLWKYGGDINIPDIQGWTPLLRAIYWENLVIIKFLLSVGAAVNTPNKDGLTPLLICTRKVNFTIINLLLEAGANINLLSKKGLTPLHQAVNQSDYNLVKLLLDKGADPNLPNSQGYTALHQAVRNGNLSLVNLLINYRADPYVEFVNGSAYHLAWREWKFNIFSHLFQRKWLK